MKLGAVPAQLTPSRGSTRRQWANHISASRNEFPPPMGRIRSTNKNQMNPDSWTPREAALAIAAEIRYLPPGAKRHITSLCLSLVSLCARYSIIQPSMLSKTGREVTLRSCQCDSSTRQRSNRSSSLRCMVGRAFDGTSDE